MQLQQTTERPAMPWNEARSPYLPYPGQNSPFSVVKPLQLRARVKAKRELLEWIEQQNPRWFAKAEQIAKRELVKQSRLGLTPLIPRYSQDMNVRAATMGQATPPINPTVAEEKAEESWLDKLVGAAKDIAPAFIQFKQQKEILDMQVERAKQGLPPLEAAYIAPTVRIQTELSPEMMTTARAGITEGLQKLAIPLMLVGGVALVMMTGKRRRRR